MVQEKIGIKSCPPDAGPCPPSVWRIEREIMDYYKKKLDEREELAELTFWLVVIGLPVCGIALLISVIFG